MGKARAEGRQADSGAGPQVAGARVQAGAEAGAARNAAESAKTADLLQVL